MPYPQRLIPDPDQHEIIKKDDLNRQEILCRWVSPDLPFKESDGSLAGGAVAEQGDHIYNFERNTGYSTNKIPPSLIQDVFIKFYNPKFFNQYWQEGQESANVNDADFEIRADGNHFLLQIGDFHQYQGTYPYPADRLPFNYKFVIEVIHAPQIANIAHFEFKVKAYDENDQLITPKGKSRKLLLAEIRQLIVRKAKFNHEDF